MSILCVGTVNKDAQKSLEANVNLAGIHHASREDICRATAVPFKVFLNWLTGDNIFFEKYPALAQQIGSHVWCQAIVNLFTYNSFAQLDREFRDSRTRRQRTGKNETRDAWKAEKKDRAEFKAVINKLIVEEDWSDISAMYEIQLVAEKYFLSLHEWIRKAKRSIQNMNPKVKAVANLTPLPTYTLLMLNDTTVQWSAVMVRLMEHSDNGRRGNKQYTIQPATLLRLAKLIHGNDNGTILDLTDKSQKQCVKIIRAICTHLPVMAVLKKDECVLFDLHQMTNQDWVEIINADRIEQKEIQQQKRTESSLKLHNSGGKPLHERFPNLVSVVVQFVQQNGVSAEKKRRHTTSNVGVGLETIRQHVITMIPSIKNFGISIDTVARLFMPPHEGKKTKHMYKSLIEARTPAKDDTLRLGNKNQHAAACQLKMAMEMAFDYQDECVVYAGDDKAKVSIGKMCVSKFVKYKNKFPIGASPTVLDHNFVLASCWSLTVSGYTEVLPHPRDSELQEEELKHNLPVMDFDVKETQNIFRMQAEEDSTVAVTVQARLRRRAIMGWQEDDSEVNLDLLPSSAEISLNTNGDQNTDRRDEDDSNSPQGILSCKEMDDDNEEHSIEIKRKASGRLRRRPFISSLQNSAGSPEESIAIGCLASIAQSKPTAEIQPPITKPPAPSKKQRLPPRFLVLDRHHRPHIDIPSSGKTHIYIRPTKTCASCPWTHVQDLIATHKRNPKPNVVLSVDGGSDFTCRSIKNVYWYAKFFEEANLDSLTIVQNAAGYSAYNYWIEHFWAWCSQQVIGVELTGTLPWHEGLTPKEYHTTPACTKECLANRSVTKENMNQRPIGLNKHKDDKKQRKRANTIRANKVHKIKVDCLPDCLKLKKETLKLIREDEATVFQNASEELKSYWHGKLWDSHEVNCQVMSDAIPPSVLAESQLLDRYHSCYDRKKMVLPGGEFHEMYKRYLWIFDHLLKKQTHKIVFVAQCKQDSCELKKCHETGTNMGNAMRSMNMSFDPTRGPLLGHYKTYLEQKSQDGRNQDRGDKYIRLERTNHETYLPVVCPFGGKDNAICGRGYMASSKTEKARHEKLYHHEEILKQRHWDSMVKKGRATPANLKKSKFVRKPRLYLCKHMDNPASEFYCNLSFQHYRDLIKHQHASGHTNQGRQRSPWPGVSRSKYTTTEEKKIARQKREDARKERARQITLTKSVDANGKIGTNGTSRIRGQTKKLSESDNDGTDNHYSPEEDNRYGADVNQCKSGSMAVVKVDYYENNERGIELYRILDMKGNRPDSVGTFPGILYNPSECSTSDPQCVKAEWISKEKKEPVSCWSVILYFPKLTGLHGSSIPKSVVTKIRAVPDLFESPSVEKKGKSTKPGHLEQLSQSENEQPDTSKENSTYGADISQCIIDRMAVVETKYANGDQGVELYRVVEIKNTKSKSETFMGILYTVVNCSTSDPRCVAAKWISKKKKEEVNCWSVILYFPKLTGQNGSFIPKNVRNKITEFRNLFHSPSIAIPERSSETLDDGGTAETNGLLKPSVRFADELQDDDVTYGASVSRCIPKNMAVVETKYTNGTRGIELFRVVKMTIKTPGQECFEGLQYLPVKKVASTDVSCLSGSWTSSKKKESHNCWSVITYFEKLIGFSGKRLPKAVIDEVTQKVFASSNYSPLFEGSLPVVAKESTPELNVQSKKRAREPTPDKSVEKDSDSGCVDISVVKTTLSDTIATALETKDSSSVCTVEEVYDSATAEQAKNDSSDATFASNKINLTPLCTVNSSVNPVENNDSDDDAVPVKFNIIVKPSFDTTSTIVHNLVAMKTSLETKDLPSVGTYAETFESAIFPITDEEQDDKPDCKPDYFMICYQRFDDGKGIDLFKIKAVHDETIEGTKYVPHTKGRLTTDPLCLQERWRTFRKTDVVPIWSVLQCFPYLNQNGGIPKKIQTAIMQQHQKSTIFSSQVEKTSPQKQIQILKERKSISTGSPQYLIEEESGDMQWLEEEQVEQEEVVEWNNRVYWQNAERYSEHHKPKCEPWLSPVNSYQLLNYDRLIISEGGPLNQVIVDVCMTILAGQTSRFTMLPCVPPIAGYTRVLNDSHLHVHHCGRTQHHFVSSVYVGNTIWYMDYNQPSCIPPIVMTALIDMYITDIQEHAINILRLTKQKRRHTCGILSIAAIVELALSKSNVIDPCLLSSLEFDEDKAPEWLLSCLKNGKFDPCPKVPIAATSNCISSLSAESCDLPYTIMAVTSCFLKNLRGANYRISAANYVERKESLHGSGPSVDGNFVAMPISEGQKANCRLLVGCTINMESRDDHTKGLYVVTSVNNRQNSMTVSSISYPGLTNLPIPINRSYGFFIAGPPSFRSTDYLLNTSMCRLRSAKKVIIVYPVCRGQLSNTIFSSTLIHEYTVIEAEPCVTRFDVDCLLRFLAGRQINLQVRIVDLFPINCLASFYPERPDLTQLNELYCTVLDCLFEEHKVVCEVNPFINNRITKYPVEMLPVASDAPPFGERLFLKIHKQFSQAARQKKLTIQAAEKKIGTILESGSQKVFQEATVGDIHDWGWSTADTELANRPVITLEWSDHAEDSSSVLCYVMNHKIIKCDAGLQLLDAEFALLEKSCKIFVNEMMKYCGRLPDDLNEKSGVKHELNEWRQLGDFEYGCYRLKMYLQNGVPTISDVQGVHAHYDTRIENMTGAITVGGLVNYGGQKLVLAGISHIYDANDRVVLVLPRFSDCDRAKKIFEAEMKMMGLMGVSEYGVKIKHVDTAQGWALLERLEGTIEEYLYYKSNGLEKSVTIIDVLLKSSLALAAVHEKSILHRDVKPDNFLYEFVNRRIGGTELHVKISDFGLAMFVSQESGNACVATGDVGTSSYKAPEVINGKSYGKKADVYSFGITIYELVYSRRRFTQLNHGFRNQSILKDLEEYAASIPTPTLTGEHGEEIDQLIRNCTKKSASHRPTMQNVVSTLKMITLKECQPNVTPPVKKPTLQIQKRTKKAFASVLSEVR